MFVLQHRSRATNLVTGIANAKMDSILVVITGQVKILLERTFQETDILELRYQLLNTLQFVIQTPEIIAEAFHCSKWTTWSSID